ncbi:MAG: hypothetical protein ACRDL2_04160 [Gaiellaceae bacterium]
MERYEIRLSGHLGEFMLAAFPSLSAEICGPETVLRGAVRDSAALYGLLAQLESMHLELIELRRLPRGAAGLPDEGGAQLPRPRGES